MHAFEKCGIELSVHMIFKIDRMNRNMKKIAELQRSRLFREAGFKNRKNARQKFG